jgi:hypothetical protein
MPKIRGMRGLTMADRDRLIELLDVCLDENVDVCSAGYDCWREINYEGIADHLLANGVIAPKYNVGDTVWYITGIHRTIVKSAIVEEIIINCNGVSDLFVTSDTGSFENSVDIFYSSKEEAEKALKEREGNG